MGEWFFWGSLLAVVDLVLACGVTVHAVLWKRDYRSVLAWVGVAWFAPIVGSCAYLCFGINRLHRKATSLQLSNSARHPRLSPEDHLEIERFADEYPNLVGLAGAGRRLTGLALLPGNRIEPLLNGDEAFPAMLESIENAERSVALESYIFDSDRVGDQFLDALVAAKSRGVEVRVLVDDVGSKYSRPNMARRLKAAGVPSAVFLPTRLPRLPTTANMRNHRKLLIVDGRVGFTGGTNIREGHALELHPSYPVRCIHFRVGGPVVSQLQRALAIDWAFATGEELTGDCWFPEVERGGNSWARGIEHGPDVNFEKLVDLIAAALACARSRIRIVTPYFLPQPSLMEALRVAALRGVDVEIYLPSTNNIPPVAWASTAQLWQILQKGCRVFSTPPPFDHSKVMIVDDVWSLVGSTNWDPRSLRLNFEFNVECFDPALAERLNGIVDEKAHDARQITLADVNRRSLPIRLRDGLARLLTPYL